jgi:transcriptional regulator with XRE-family HTH domain
MRKALGGDYGKDSTSFDEHIGGKLRERRTAAKLSQTILGKAIGVSFQQIQKFEAGRNRMSVGQLWLLCNFLDVPITSMFEGANIRMFKPQQWAQSVRAPGRRKTKSRGRLRPSKDAIR